MIVHVDMDAFFAAVEQRDNPELAGKCVVVGRLSGRGVVAAASYEARAYGVRSAMPVMRAQKICPQAVFVPPGRARYKEVSREVMAVLSNFSPLVEPVSIDEAYLDISGSGRLLGPPEVVAQKIKAAVFDAVSLTCSVGIAPLRFLAKIASDMNKPDGQTIITEQDVDRFIRQLPVEQVPGVGPVNRRQLTLLGITTLGDVREFSEALLTDKLGAVGKRLAALAAGQDDTPLTPATAPKSVSAETTLAQDTRDRDLLCRYLLNQADDVARQLRRLGATARVVVLKLKDSDFKEKTRQITLPGATASAVTIYHQAVALLDAHLGQRPLRLIGLGASGLAWSSSSGRQLGLFEETDTGEKKWIQVEQALDAVTEKFGKQSVKRASQNE